MSQQRGGFQLDAKTMGLATSKPTNASQQEQEQKTDQQSSNTGHSQCNPGLSPLPTEHFSSQVQKLRGICGDGATMNFEMNDMFLKRLVSIDEQCGGDSVDLLRLVTLQDWVDQLLHVNYILFGNMSALEMEAYKKIMDCFQSSRGEQQQSLDENRNLRKDLCAIVKLVQEAYHHNNWNTNDMCLETLTVNQLLGLQDCECPESESAKVKKCMESLANEVAAKHDEVCHLQSQLVAVDEVVQTARQKIILKDKCIAQLNQQLVEMQDCVSKMSKDSSKDLHADYTRDSELEFGSVETSSCLFENLNEKDQQESELLRMLNIELTEFIELVNKQDFSGIERRRKLISCFFERISLERTTTQKSLENLRSQLRALECELDQLDEPIAASTEIIESDADTRIVETLRRHLQSLHKCNKDLNTRYEHDKAQYEVELLEWQFSYDAEHSINQKNCQALKEIADLLSKLRCSDLTYEEIYTGAPVRNPFCVAIMELFENLNVLEQSVNKLEENNERLVCQIHSLKCDLEDREGQLQELRLVVNGYADISETNRLKDEIFRLKQKNTDQAKKIGELTKVIKDQEEERTQLCINYETLSNTSHVQSKDLDRAKRDVQSLQDRLSQVEKTQEDLKTERNLLREEIIALKEKDAISTGRERALNDELQRRQQELDKSRNLYVHLHTLKQQLEEQHKDTVSRLCQTNEDIRLQLQAVSSECKEWQNKLKKQTNLTDQHQLIIESFRMWKDAQLRADEAMRQCIKKAEDNITGLVKENNRLTEQYQRLCGDYITLENEMRRIKSAVNIRLPSGSELPEAFLRGQKVHDEMIERLQYMRLCSKRLSDQVQTVNHSPGILNQEYTLDQTTPTTTTSGQQQQPENQEEYHQLTPSKNAWQSHRPH